MVQAAALLRVLAELPGFSNLAPLFFLSSAACWLGAFVSWFFKFTPMYWRPVNQ